MVDYMNLNDHRKDGWKRDPLVQMIIGEDLSRLDSVAQFRDMSEPAKVRFRTTMLNEYRSLSSTQQQSWQKDQIVGMIMGEDWWRK